jgi:hypothetical protein
VGENNDLVGTVWFQPREEIVMNKWRPDNWSKIRDEQDNPELWNPEDSEYFEAGADAILEALTEEDIVKLVYMVNAETGKRELYFQPFKGFIQGIKIK